MTPGEPSLVFLASVAVSTLGVGLWLISWFGKGDPIRKQRLLDAGLVLVFSGVAARVAIEPQRTTIDWILGGLSVIFISAALWRLTHTQRHAEGKPE